MRKCKVWAMAVCGGDNSQLVTGGADSTLHLWADRTREQKQTQAAAAEQLVLRQEELANCLRAKNFRKAVKLAFILDQPLRMVHIFEQMLVHGKLPSCLVRVPLFTIGSLSTGSGRYNRSGVQASRANELLALYSVAPFSVHR
jgi:hypothetical protein